MLLRELFRAGFDGTRLTFGYAATPKLLESLPHEVTEGLAVFSPSPDLDSPAFAAVKQALGADPDPYSCQTHDHASLALLAVAKAGEATGAAIHDAVRQVSQGDGERVSSALDGLRALAAGRQVNFEGASGPCDFLPSGDIETCKFRFDQVRGGKLALLSIS